MTHQLPFAGRLRRSRNLDCLKARCWHSWHAGCLPLGYRTRRSLTKSQALHARFWAPQTSQNISGVKGLTDTSLMASILSACVAQITSYHSRQHRALSTNRTPTALKPPAPNASLLPSIWRSAAPHALGRAAPNAAPRRTNTAARRSLGNSAPTRARTATKLNQRETPASFVSGPYSFELHVVSDPI